MSTSPARTLKGSRRLQRRRDRRSKSPQWQFLRGFLKNPVMVGSIIPSSKVLIEKMLDPVDWANTRLFVEYGPGVGTFTRPVLERLGARRDAGDDRHQCRLHALPQGIDRRSAPGRGHRLGRRRREDPRRPRPRLGRLCALGAALLDPSAGRRRRHRRGDGQGHPARRRVPGLSVQPQGAAISSSPISTPIKRGFEWINVPPATLFWAYKGEADEPRLRRGS